MTAVWPGMIVADSNLPTQIWARRIVFDWERMQGSCIQTVAGRGYRFVPVVTRSAAEVWPASPWISSAAAPANLSPRPACRSSWCRLTISATVATIITLHTG
jgi:DNA-binding winged helix-turn-helix (wHTH) protein